MSSDCPQPVIAISGIPSPKRVPLETVETVLRLYQEQYFDFNVRHFHEKLRSEHQIELSYTWVKQALTPPRKATKSVASRSGLEKSGQKAA